MNPSAEEIGKQLRRITQSPDFVAGPKLTAFLQYVVKETLEGRSDQIKQYTIAVDGLGYAPEFDPMTSPTVRILAQRLRRALNDYYQQPGLTDDIRVQIPKGRYIPVFLSNTPPSHKTEAANAQPDSNEAESADESPLSDFPSIAVVPLEFIGNGSDHDYIATGLTEEILIALSRFPELSVVGPLSTDIVHQRNLGPRAIGREFRVRFVLTGSLRRRDGMLRVSIRLTDASSARQIWNRVFEYGFEFLSTTELEDDLVGRIVSEIADNFGVIPRTLSRELFAETGRRPSAYEAILRFHHHNRTLTEETLAQATEALEVAVEEDPENDLTLAMLADLIGTPYFMGFIDDLACLELSEEAAKKALALNPNSQEAHFTLAQVSYARLQEGPCLKAIEPTLELNPYNANYLAICAIFLRGIGQIDRAKALIQKAKRLNPHHPGWYYFVPYLDHYSKCDFESALVDAHNFNTRGYFWDPLIRSAVLGQLGRTQEANQAVQELIALDPDFGARGRGLIRRMVFRKENMEHLAEGLNKAGLALQDGG